LEDVPILHALAIVSEKNCVHVAIPCAIVAIPFATIGVLEFVLHLWNYLYLLPTPFLSLYPARLIFPFQFCF